jgi:two-component system alkaline phosphatase synthesis response regulator PhoP
MLADESLSHAPGPILVIDDEPFILRAMSYLLTREGFQVATADNRGVGLELVCRLHPPLVFLDIMMPVLDGYEVCEQIRRDNSLAGTHVIMLSAKGQQSDQQRGLLGGANEYMTKPFSPREVAGHVRTLLTGPERQSA